MDARPNVLNKILPCTKNMSIEYIYAQGTVYRTLGFNLHRLDASNAEYVDYSGIIPNDIKAGSDIIFKLLSMPYQTNDTGAAKTACAIPYYSSVRVGQVIVSLTVGNTVSITIPDNETAFTVHYDDVLTFPNLLAGDMFHVRLYRHATNELDTYPYDYCFNAVIMARYITDKIGVI